MTKKELILAARELNKVMGLEPPINLKGDMQKISTLILEAAEFLVENDELSDKTMELIYALRNDVEEEQKEEELQEEKEINEEEEIEEEKVSQQQEDEKKEKPQRKKQQRQQKKEEKKKERVKKVEPVEDKKSTEKTDFGHLKSSQAGKIDLVLLKNANKEIYIAEIEQQTGATKSRILGHVKHLQKKNIDVKVAESKVLYSV